MQLITDESELTLGCHTALAEQLKTTQAMLQAALARQEAVESENARLATRLCRLQDRPLQSDL